MRTCSYENCKMPVWGTDRSTQLGFCKNHQWCRTDLDRRSSVQKHFDKAKEKELVAGDIEFARELEQWYAAVAAEIKKHPYCMETGEFIPERFYRAASAHLLPKAIFKSVATHRNNFLILSAGSGAHHRWDNGDRVGMNVFEEAVKRYSTFAHLVKEKHKLLNIFAEYATESN